MQNILFFGLTTVDIFNFVKSYPGSNEKVRAEEQMVYAGGPAANGSVACSALGKRTTLITGLGKHPLAGLSKNDLAQNGVKLLDWPEHPEQLPVLSSITVDLSNGDRSVIYTDTEKRNLSLEKEPEDILTGVSLIMFDGYFIDQALEIACEAEKRSIPVVLDGGSWKTGLEKLLPFVNYGICSKDFYPPGCGDVESILDYLQKCGIEYVAVTGGECAIHYREKNRSGQISVQEVTVEDTLGAGDILHGAFCAYCLENNFAESLELASKVATESCKMRGTRSWIGLYQP